MKRKTGISLMLALLMIVSSFAVIGVAGTGTENYPPGEVFFEKQVWDEDGQEWVESIDVESGDTVNFKITMTYQKDETAPSTWYLKNIKIKDKLPDCLVFADDVTITTNSSSAIEYNEEVSGKWIYWNFSSYKPKLYNGNWLSIEFNATIGECDPGEYCNMAYFYGFETCGHYEHEGNDDACVQIIECGEPDIDIDKKVWDEDLEDWTDGPVTAYEGDTVYFKLNVTNTGDVVLHNVIVTDVVPDFFNNGGTYPSNIGNLNPEEYWEHIFSSTVIDIDEVLTDDNYANVTADEEVYDEDSVTVTVKPHFILEKKVWNGSEWSEYLHSVRIGESVKFKITGIYYGEESMKCAIVADLLPYCVEYNKTLIVEIAGDEISPDDSRYPDIYATEGETIKICGYDFELPAGAIVWDWQQPNLYLLDGEGFSIEFETTVIEYCEECDECYPPCQDPCVQLNCAIGAIWGCAQCTPCHWYADYDCAKIRCCPPPTTFEKKVWNNGEWADEGVGVVNHLMKFKLSFEYYGNEVLEYVNIKDQLPCILEFEEVVSSDINISVWVSENKKIVWFNMSEDTIEDGDLVEIVFTAMVTGISGDCCPGAKNRAWLYILDCTGQIIDDFYDEVNITTYQNYAPCPPIISGPEEGKAGQVLTYEIVISDPNNDDVWLYINWGDESPDEWIGPYSTPDTIEVTHTFETEGEYVVKAKAKDIWDEESIWGNDLEVEITGTAPPELQVCISRGLGLKVNIKNNRESEINNVDWNLTVTKGILGREIYQDNDTFASIAGGATEVVTGTPFGVGRIKITAEVDAEGMDPIVQEAKGFIVLGFVWVRYL